MISFICIAYSFPLTAGMEKEFDVEFLNSKACKLKTDFFIDRIVWYE